MKKVTVNLGHRSYDILIGQDLLAQTSRLFEQQSVGKRVFLIANTTVYDLYGEVVEQSLTDGGFDVFHILIPDGEPCKNLHTVENIYTYLIAQRADRRSTLAALGGGVTGDIVGFVAATFMRGVPYIQIPTTLLAQVDSSVGGKTGVNHRLGKNLIGAFYQPNLVCVDTNSLSTLPEREFFAGIYEVLKYGLIYDEAFWDWLVEHLDSIRRREPEAMETLISRCCEIKAEVTSLDEKESDLRRILNFGHTLGHALEAATEYGRFKHGEAVAYGMMAATHLSQRHGQIDQATCNRICDAIRSVGPLPEARSVPFQMLSDAIRHDKKREGDQTVFVLLKRIGQTLIASGFDNALLEEVWTQAVAPTSDS
ncbi:MAG: 3-dehydroquinate synthase [Acidobacteriota bacterium]|nr:MAG: 3-dehydroquinate synthase [Acidobacteriota bacterium]